MINVSDGAGSGALTFQPGTTTVVLSVTDAASNIAATCSFTVSTTIITSIAGPALVCPGEPATLTATGGVSYAWSTGGSGATVSVSPSETTTYSVTATDVNGCTGTAIFILNVTPQTLSDTPLEHFWATDGSVQAIQYDSLNNLIYLGGDFSRVGPSEAFGAVVNREDGVVNYSAVNPNGGVEIAISDSAGGWYIGGYFTEVGGQPRSHLARINADGSLNSWNPGANNFVKTLALRGNTVYAGGYFTSVGGESRNYTAAIDAATGEVMDWNPSANAPVNILAVGDGMVYAGGDFDFIGGQSCNYITKLDAVTGLADADWNPFGADRTVLTLALSEGIVYVGGYFNSIGGMFRNN
ncbi:MAG: hypothetical protein ACR2K1_01435, partial [Saprospiraceae bacterium]